MDVNGTVTIKIVVDSPALDTIAAWLTGKEQAKIDALKAKVDTAVSALGISSDDLWAAVESEQPQPKVKGAK